MENKSLDIDKLTEEYRSERNKIMSEINRLYGDVDEVIYNLESLAKSHFEKLGEQKERERIVGIIKEKLKDHWLEDCNPIVILENLITAILSINSTESNDKWRVKWM